MKLLQARQQLYHILMGRLSYHNIALIPFKNQSKTYLKDSSWSRFTYTSFCCKIQVSYSIVNNCLLVKQMNWKHRFCFGSILNTHRYLTVKCISVPFVSQVFVNGHNIQFLYLCMNVRLKHIFSFSSKWLFYLCNYCKKILKSSKYEFVNDLMYRFQVVEFKYNSNIHYFNFITM